MGGAGSPYPIGITFLFDLHFGQTGFLAFRFTRPPFFVLTVTNESYRISPLFSLHLSIHHPHHLQELIFGE